MVKPTDKLTDALVRKLTPPEAGNRVAYDSEVKGFGVRITAAGARAFVLNYRIAGRERRYTIGAFPDWSVSAAREEAKALKQRVDRGDDPLQDRQDARAAPTVADLIDQFKKDYLPRKRPSTQSDYQRWLDRFVAPKLGGMKVADVQHADIDALHRSISKDTPTQANRVVAVLSRMFALAIKWGMRPDNPVPGVERNTEDKRHRFVSPEEIAHLSAALAGHRQQGSANAIRLLLLTGARRGEVLGARWDMFDLQAGVWVKPSAHTKQKREHRVPLSAPVLALLTAMRQKAAEGEEYLFPSRTGEGHQAEIQNFWEAVTRHATVAMWAAAPDTVPGRLVGELVAAAERAKGGRDPAAARLPTYADVVKLAVVQNVKLPPGLTDVRVHDLRHTFASILVSSGASLPLIGALLGHTQASTTQRYAHLFDDPLRAAAERVGALVSGVSGQGTNVVQMKRGA